MVLAGASPAAAESWKLPIAPKLTIPADEPAPKLPDYAIPDIRAGKLFIPRIQTSVATAKPGVELIFDGTVMDQDEISREQLGDQADKLEIRSARLQLSGEVGLHRLLSYSMKIDYNGFDAAEEDDFSINEFNVSFAIPAWRTKISMGQMREDFGYEAVASMSIMPQSERMMSPFISPVNTGVKVMHLLGPENRMLLTYGLFKDEWGEGKGHEAVSARFTGLAIDQPERHRYLHLGVAVRSSVINGEMRYKGKPGINAAGNYVDTGDFPASDTRHVGFEMLYSQGPFTLMAEHISARVDAPDVGNPTFHGWYVLGSWVISGEARSYDKTKGVANRIVPLQRWGAPELVARYAHVELNGGSINGGRFERVEAGVNWWATNHWKFGLLAGHVWLDRFGETGQTSSLLTRVQWTY